MLVLVKVSTAVDNKPAEHFDGQLRVCQVGGGWRNEGRFLENALRKICEAGVE